MYTDGVRSGVSAAREAWLQRSPREIVCEVCKDPSTSPSLASLSLRPCAPYP